MDPEQIDVILEHANQLLESGQADESLRCLDQIEGLLVDSDDRIEFASLRACALVEVGRSKDALQTLEPLLDEFPDSARLYGALGIVLSNGYNLTQARAALEKAVSLDNENESLLANLALVYEMLRDYKTALQLYERAIELGADLDWALQRKAAALSEMGDYDSAKATLHRYLSLVPDDVDQWITLGILHSDDEEYERALTCYEQAAALAPDSVALRINWGVTAVRAGQLTTAQSQLSELRRVDPDSSRPVLLQAFILEEQGDISGAERCYRRALGRVQDDDYAELTYALEMAMDFHARRKESARCDELLHRAYATNACTVDLLEPYRELTGRYLRRGYWYALLVEADYRPGLHEVREQASPGTGPPIRYQRDIEIVARDRDEALTIVLEFLNRMGETSICVCEFTREEDLNDVYSGLYSIERESYVSAAG
ncbi:MAG: tetratricopeptide repeat protein [Planctomycetota bacterium]